MPIPSHLVTRRSPSTSLDAFGLRANHSSSARGFTLIELMIVVAIVAIIASIAYPSYQEQVRQSRRADAQAALYELSQFMERFYSTNGRYVTNAANGARPALPFATAPKDGGGPATYNLQFNETGIAVADRGARYVLEAVPVNAMAGDGCGTLRLSNTGLRTRTGALPENRCWRN